MTKSLRTLIEWADYTLNFWWGCTKVSPACEHCYAEVIAKVFSKGKATWGHSGARWQQWEGATKKLRKIVRAAKREGIRPRVFVNSMSDTFEENALLDVTRCMALVAMAEVTDVDFLLLTKRPENVCKMVPPAWLEQWPAHVWIGTTVEDQARADERIPALLRIPARVRFLSCEPLLGPVHFSNVTNRSDAVQQLGKKALTGIHWVICGGESGGGARPMHPDWARSLRDQCAATAVPFFFKQWGEWAPGECVDVQGTLKCASFAERKWDYSTQTENQSQHCHAADAPDVFRIGNKAAGRLLDGVEHNGLPEVHT